MNCYCCIDMCAYTVWGLGISRWCIGGDEEAYYLCICLINNADKHTSYACQCHLGTTRSPAIPSQFVLRNAMCY